MIFRPLPLVSLSAALVASGLARESTPRSMPFPGPSIARTSVTRTYLSNNVLTASFEGSGNTLRLARLESPLNGLNLAWTDPYLFTIHLTGSVAPLSSASMECKASTDLAGGAVFTDKTTGLRAEWRPLMTDGSNYLRMALTLTATSEPVSVDRIEMINAPIEGATVTGPYDGMPVVTDKLFLGIEHPMAKNTLRVNDGWSPVEMAARRFSMPLTNITGGSMKVTFNYQNGNHGIAVAKVALLDPAGKVAAEDTHEGFSGHASRNNTYQLAVPPGVTSGTLEVILGGLAPDTDSHGRIAVEGASAQSSSMVTCSLPRRCELTPGTPWTTFVGIGVFPKGQLRRAFLYYLERERAHRYRQYWHYNSWYDLNIGNNDNPDPLKRMNEAQCLDVIETFGRELYQKRGVGLDGYVWDDGWDDWNTLWGFHKGFPNGFTKLKEAASKQGAGMGAWLSPWGGYGQSHALRVKYGSEHGFETNAGGFALGGPRYFAAYRDVCLKMIRDYNQNYFKFDGIGGGTMANGAPTSVAPDLDALVRLLGELRRANPEVFINCTVGTWPSPYWAWFADSIWRQGEDCGYAGEGNGREQWITYRDHMIHSRFAVPSPLYPLNSMMYHGLLVGDRQLPARMPAPSANPESCRHEILMSVGCGSGLGELYVTHKLMTSEAWDLLAEGIRWSRSRAAILCDTHRVGGDPVKEVYGYAAWHPQHGGTLVLRNPTSRELSFTLDPQQLFELPAGAPQTYRFAPALGTGRSPVNAAAGQSATLTLKAFEVLVFDAASVS